MKAFIIILSSFFLVSCVVGSSDDSAFRDRDKTDARPRANLNQDEEEENQSEEEADNQTDAGGSAQSTEKETISYIFPVEITNNLKSLKIKSNDNKRIHISAIGGDILLLAPQTGALTINSLQSQYHLAISIGKGRSLNLLLEKSKTSLKVSSKTEVTQRQLIAQTSSAATFYISKDGKDLVLCLGDISAKIPIVKELKDIEACR